MLEWYLDTARGADRLLVPGGLRLSLEHPPAAGHRPFNDLWTGPGSWFEVERVSLVAATRLAADCGLHAIAWHLRRSLRLLLLSPDLPGRLAGHPRDWSGRRPAGRQPGGRSMDADEPRGVHWKRSRYEESIDCYREGLTISREIGDRQTRVGPSPISAVRYSMLSRRSQALDCYKQALAIFQESETARTRAGFSAISGHLPKSLPV